MALSELLPALQALDRSDKLRAMQFLLQELSKEEASGRLDATEYSVWSPHEAFEAAGTLLALLKLDGTRSDE
ncbi:hypothetical protein [Gloeobacter morelensis]|uniref:Uncharacterized protein n=1 Tax=Gloeobacter morelensis MG652769 TaxID=2781736 RepID=A0ABY3PJW3_9CYAN|nr:hypothetical protein [Gloeobacter morelensis]UFP93937.1 hypothetical protein ISF26_19535 [Gloeobacter morelensis MG652769]